jgi:hypothetical protein
MPNVLTLMNAIKINDLEDEFFERVRSLHNFFLLKKNSLEQKTKIPETLEHQRKFCLLQKRINQLF